MATAANTLTGGMGNDTITGAAGNDTTIAPAVINNPYSGTPGTLATIAAPGITQAPTTGFSTTDTKVTGYDPTKWNVDTSETTKGQTVQGQLQGLISANSPLLQMAETQAKQQMNQRGLLNTSMALGAGQEAVIKQALPIATQDATLFANQAKYNADIANTQAQFKAAAQNQAYAADKAASDAAAQFEAAAKNTSSAQYAKDLNTTVSQMMDQSMKIGMANADNATKLQVQQIDANTRRYLADIEARYKNQMQASASSTDMYTNITKNIASIMADPNLDVAAKQAAVNNQLSYLESGMDILGQTSGVGGLDELIDFTGDETGGGAEGEGAAAETPAALTAGANFQQISSQFGDVLDTSKGATVDKKGVTTVKYTDPVTNKTSSFKLPAGSYFDSSKGQIVDGTGKAVPVPSGLIAGAVTPEQRAKISAGIQPGDSPTEIASTFANTGVNTTGATVTSKGEVKLKGGTVIPAGAVVVGDQIYKPDGTLVSIKPKDLTPAPTTTTSNKGGPVSQVANATTSGKTSTTGTTTGGKTSTTGTTTGGKTSTTGTTTGGKTSTTSTTSASNKLTSNANKTTALGQRIYSGATGGKTSTTGTTTGGKTSTSSSGSSSKSSSSSSGSSSKSSSSSSSSSSKSSSSSSSSSSKGSSSSSSSSSKGSSSSKKG